MVGKCLVNGVCAKVGVAKPGNQCLFCIPAKDPFAWSEEQFTDCDDGNACTEDDQCIDGACKGTPTVCDDGNLCTQDICDKNAGCWHPAANVPCDDGDPCTGLDFCKDGDCMSGFTPPCDDGNPCTEDYCMAGKGCFYKMLDGSACDDGDECTVGDTCVEKECVPGPGVVECDDFNDCTSDTCDPLVACTYPLNGNPCCINDINICDDKDPCTIDSCDVDTGACVYLPNVGKCSDKNACTTDDTCVAGVCSGVETDCDDGTACTDDFCDTKAGCIHAPVNQACDDGSVCTLDDWCNDGVCTGTKVDCNDFNVCTTDSCDPVAGCVHGKNDVLCNDFDLCTGQDACVGGACKGTAKSCDDGNPCTLDSCSPASGCQNLFAATPCDDGNPCTTGDACSGGKCVGGAVVCESCDYEFSDAVDRANKMAIAKDATAATALDLNGDGKYDNSMAGIAGLANEPLQDSLDKGSVHLLLEHHDFKSTGGLYTLAAFVGELASGYETCEFTSAYCGYVASADSVDMDTCTALVAFDNATVFQGKLTAGGAAYKFPWQIPLAEGTVLSITLYNAVIKADVTVKQGVVSSMTGIIGGAIPKQSFIDAINALPDEGLPLPKAMILQLVQGLIKNDIDTNKDGSPDAASIAISFTAIAGGIVGMQ